ncbi:MAG: NAD-dependent epimerase/dehydratase family protein [Bryobacteraceae bacterium]|nr:NAD-dependent epimerase/dehydratase family protein [Bryobacteraceae bacterium]
MRIFLTGATGYVGRAVAQSLREAGHTVAGLARNPEAVLKLHRAGIEAVNGDLGNPPSIGQAASHSDAVIHTAMDWGPRTGELDTAAVEAILNALDGSRRPFVYTSGSWVMGDTKGRVVGEIFPPRPPAFLSWRPPVEKLVLAASERKVKGTVIRPAMVYGRKGGAPADFVKQARENGVVRYVGSGDNHWSFVHVDALAELFRLAVEQEPAGELLLASDGPAFQVKTVAEAAAWAGGASGRTEGWPVEEARQTLGPVVDALVLDQRIMSTKAGRMLGWGMKTPSVLEELMRGSYVQP